MHYLEHGRRDIAELAALAELAGIADNNERNGVRRVRGEGLAVVAYHAVCVAVIRSDERYAALGSDEVNESAEDLGKRVPEWVKVLAYVIAKNYRCRYYMQTSHGAYDYWSGRHTVTGSRFVFVGESQDATVAAGCFRATKHAIETCFKKFCDKRFEQDGTKIGRRAGVKNSYCLGFIEGLENSYREQLEQDETMALAIVVPESVNRYMNDELNCKKMKPRPITVSSDSSIEDSGRQDGYGFGQGDRIASCA